MTSTHVELPKRVDALVVGDVIAGPGRWPLIITAITHADYGARTIHVVEKIEPGQPTWSVRLADEAMVTTFAQPADDDEFDL